MKRIIIAIFIATVFFVQAFGQEQTTSKEATTPIESTSVDTKKGDTVIITEWEDDIAETPKGIHTKKGKSYNQNMPDLPFDMDSMAKGGIAVSILAVALIFGLPFFVIFIAFFFRYKNRKAKYQLIEKALESGQPLPKGLIDEISTNKNLKAKGIKNVFTGLGLFVFLWAITESFGVGAIGLLILCTGIGQIFIARSQDIENQKNDRSEF